LPTFAISAWKIQRSISQVINVTSINSSAQHAESNPFVDRKTNAHKIT